MFHKEQSLQGRSKHKAVDVPVRKSDRRKILERAKQFFQQAIHLDSSEPSSLEQLLQVTFLQGNLSMRSIPMQGGKAWNMIMYLKSPTTSNSNSNSNSHDNGGSAGAGAGGGTTNADRSTTVWPYTTSSQFVWMALEEKSKVVRETPTVALWAVLSNHPSLSPTILQTCYACLVPSAVSKFVCRGSDLMRAGMRSLPPADCRRPIGNMIAIVAQGNPQPFAVGWSSPSTSPDEEPYGVGTNGVGVEVWNAYGDELWRQSHTKGQCKGIEHTNEFGGSLPFDNGHYGNVGFQDGKWVLPLVDPDDSASSDEDSQGENVESMYDANGPKSVWEEPGDAQGVTTGSVKEETAAMDNLQVTSQEAEEDVGALSDPTSTSPDETETSTEASFSPDDVLHLSVCRALLSLSNKDFPLLVSSFYAQVKEYQPPGTTLDLKSTTYKKFGTYIKAQVARQLLQVGPDRSNSKNTDPSALLMGYYKKHEDLIGMEKPAPPISTSNTIQMKLVMVNLYTFPQNWPSLLRLEDHDVKAVHASSEERRGTGMLTAAEVRKILEAYILREELVPSGRPDQVILDGPLTQAIYKKQANTPERLLRKDLVKLFVTKLSTAYALVEMPGSKITKLARGTPPKIEIEVSMRQSKKFVTRVRGLEDYGVDPAYFSKDVARRLACSASIETTAQSGRPALRKKHVELVFQGNLVEEIEALLVDESLSSHGGVKGSEYSVPKQVLDFNLRRGVPGRKKGGSSKRA